MQIEAVGLGVCTSIGNINSKLRINYHSARVISILLYIIRTPTPPLPPINRNGVKNSIRPFALYQIHRKWQIYNKYKMGLKYKA